MNLTLVFLGLFLSVIAGGLIVSYFNATNKSHFIKKRLIERALGEIDFE